MNKVKITGNSNLDNKIEDFLSDYIDCIQEAIQNAKEGKQIDDKAIYALGDAVRSIHYIKKLMQKPEEVLDRENVEGISDRETNIKIQCIILSYISYVKEAIANLKNGTQIDEKSINTLGEAIRDIHIIKKTIEKPIGPLG